MLVTVTPLDRWWSRALAGPWEDPGGDVLIVLGGALQDDNVIGENSYLRSVYARLAWQEGGFREVIVTGGGGERTPIAVPMRDFLVCSGVPREAIRIETDSGNTRENALFVRKLLASGPARRLILMTSDYHMFRAHRAFRKLGLEVLPRPIPDAGKRGGLWRYRWPVFLDLVQESGKIAYYYARGWI